MDTGIGQGSLKPATFSDSLEQVLNETLGRLYRFDLAFKWLDSTACGQLDFLNAPRTSERNCQQVGSPEGSPSSVYVHLNVLATLLCLRALLRAPGSNSTRVVAVVLGVQILLVVLVVLN